MLRTALAAALTVVLGATGTVLAQPAAAGDLNVTLPMTTLREIAVDDAHVYLTAFSSNVVVVRNLSGGAVTTITGQQGASGMALSPDGTRLYVALAAGDAISAIDTTTLTEVARYATGAGTCPTYVSATGTAVWFSYGCTNTQWNADLGVLDLAGETPVVTLARLPAEFSYLEYTAPRLELTPDGSRLLATTQGISPSSFYSLTVSGTTLAWNADHSPAVSDLAVSADGSRVYTPDGKGYLTSDLSSAATFGSGWYGSAVAATAGFVAFGTNNSAAPDVRTYKENGTLVRSYELGETPWENGMAFAPDGATLYAVTQPDYPNNAALHLRVLRDPTKTATTITMTKPSTAKINTSYTVTGSLKTVPGGSTVHVKRTSAYGTVTLPNVTTSATGVFSFTDKVGKRGTYTYTATYDGDATRAATAKTLGVPVKGLVPGMSITTNASSYKYGTVATVTGHLGTTRTNRVLRLSAKAYGGTARTLKTATVNGSGNVSATYTMSRRTAFYAYFSGDEIYEPRTVVVTRTSSAHVAQALRGYYGTSGSYRLYRTSVDPGIEAKVSPNRAGTCMTFLAQRYYSGAWHTTASSPCFALDSYSTAGAILSGDAVAGQPYRMRSTFAGDPSNLRTVGAWQYLKFTS